MSRRILERRRPMRRPLVLAGLLAATLVATVFLASCAESDESANVPGVESVVAGSTPSTAMGSTQSTASGSTETSIPERLVVGGKSVEEYLAEIPELEKALAANPEDLTTLQALAVAQYNSGDLEAAADTYITMLSIEKSAAFHNNYGNVLRDMKKHEDAKAQYLAAIEMDPSHVNAYVNAITLYAVEGRFSDAIALADQGIENTAGTDRQRLQDMKTALSERK